MVGETISFTLHSGHRTCFVVRDHGPAETPTSKETQGIAMPAAVHLSTSSSTTAGAKVHALGKRSLRSRHAAAPSVKRGKAAGEEEAAGGMLRLGFWRQTYAGRGAMDKAHKTTHGSLLPWPVALEQKWEGQDAFCADMDSIICTVKTPTGFMGFSRCRICNRAIPPAQSRISTSLINSWYWGVFGLDAYGLQFEGFLRKAYRFLAYFSPKINEPKVLSVIRSRADPNGSLEYRGNGFHVTEGYLHYVREHNVQATDEERQTVSVLVE